MSLSQHEHQLIDTLGRQQELDPAIQRLQETLENTFNAGGPLGQQVEDFLHGTWLGHPLHPVLVEIPVGAWTVVEVLDLLDVMAGREELGPGADAALAVGLVGALGAAATGLTDWKDTNGEARRLGFIHGMLNVSATALFGASLILRRRNQRGPARQLSLVGYAIALASAYLGGDLVYRQRIGVNHAFDVIPPVQSQTQTPEHYVAALDETALPEGTMRVVEVNGTAIMLARQGGKIYALANRCAHQGGPLADGQLDENSVQCPWHGSRFALADGAVLEGPSPYEQPCFATRVRDGKIEVRAG